MNDGIDALGTLAGGALTARALEPAASGTNPGAATVAEPEDGHTSERACLNCGTMLAGNHCHSCGQRAHVHRTIGAFGHDLLHGVLHFEGKTWRTLPLLAWKPGKLTREYIDGRRASYVSPIALFLFVVFLTFAVFNSLGGVHLGEGIQVSPARSLASVRTALETQITERQEARASAVADGRPVAAIDAELARLRRDRGAIASMTLPDVMDEVRGDGPGGTAVADTLNAAWMKAKDNPALLIYKLQSNAYKYSWLLIPLSLPFVWLLFPLSRRFGAYDHIVFITYSITFMIALAGIASLLFYAGWGGTGGVLLLYAPVHMYRQLRGTYAVGRWGAVWRTLALSLFAWIAIGLFATMIGALAA